MLPRGSFRRRVSAITGDAELVEMAAVPGSSRRLRLMDGDAKTVCRISVDCTVATDPRRDRARPGQRRVRVIPVKGYEAIAGKVVARLSRQPGWKTDPESIFDEMARHRTRSDRPPAPIPPRSGHENLADSIRALLRSMETHRKAIDPAGDPEELHDFRVGLRRLRTLLGQNASTRKASRLAANLKWLGQVSGSARDLDVQAQDLGRALRERCPGEPAAHDCIAALIEAWRQDAHRKLRDAFESKRYACVRRTIRRGLGVAPSGKEGNGRRRALPEPEARIPMLYRTALRRGGDLDPRADDERFHRLRKTIKKLRYLLESLPAQGANRERESTIKVLKGMQTALGDLNDACVQRALLDRLRTGIETRSERPEDALRCLDVLLACSEERRNALKARVVQHFTHLRARRTHRELLGDALPKKGASR